MTFLKELHLKLAQYNIPHSYEFLPGDISSAERIRISLLKGKELLLQEGDTEDHRCIEINNEY